MDPRIDAITLGVADLDQATRFYRDVLGLVQQPSLPNSSRFALGPMALLLRPLGVVADNTGTKGASAPRYRDTFPGFTLTHYVESAEAVERLLGEVAARGGRIVSFPQRRAGGECSGYLADPDGYLWEVACSPS